MPTLLVSKNLGQQSAAWMESVGIRTLADLKLFGVVPAHKQVKEMFPDRVSLNLLWALQGAMLGIKWNHLPEEMKAKLRAQIGDDS